MTTAIPIVIFFLALAFYLYAYKELYDYHDSLKNPWRDYNFVFNAVLIISLGPITLWLIFQTISILYLKLGI